VQGPGTHAGYRPGDVNLLCGPAFHSAPLYHDLILPLVSGVPVVMMEKFDARQTLELIERRRVTHTHMVPTMFHRLLSLPEGVRDSYDLSSLRQINHGAAPTPVPVKRAMIGWVGPILSEYYAATEGGAGFRISSAEWLQKPGSVGKVRGPASVTVLDEAGRPCAPGVSGRVFLPNGADGVCSTYHRNDAETTRTFSGTHFTVGDTGYIDGDGYLFLTGRTADRIISGGVNIQPQEIDDVLLAHPDVVAACSVGVPNADWGEEVRAVVVVRPEIRDMAALEKALLAWAGERLAGYKVPKHVDFVDALPFSDAGKLQRADVRRRYWKDSERQI
jgi:long-chain acyl-CoA synthetase